MHPVNNSPNNTGIKNLPPAQKALIWYPYDESPEFPELGKGGRSAIIGPVYHFDPTLKSDSKFPEYFDKKLFITEWMRNWVFALDLDEKQNYRGMEQFMTKTGDFRRPIDMAFGPDAVSYTHLDVYKRQVQFCGLCPARHEGCESNRRPTLHRYAHGRLFAG